MWWPWVHVQHTQPWLKFAELTSAFERLIRHAQTVRVDDQWETHSSISNGHELAGRESSWGHSPRKGTMAASRAQQQVASCTEALRDRLGVGGASQLHAIADEIEEQGEQASLGIDGPQGAFAVWWLSRDLQTVTPRSTALRHKKRGRNRSRTRKPARRVARLEN